MNTQILSRLNPGLFNKEIHFTWTPYKVMVISCLMAAQVLLILFFLNPTGTELYNASYRNLRLAGYSFCIIIPFFLFYNIEKWLHQKLIRSWKLYHEVVSKTLLILSIISVSYFYKEIIVNELPLSLHEYFYFVIWIGLPYIPLLLPATIIVDLFFFRNDTVHQKTRNLITISGKNKDEKLRFKESDFIFAEANQNYVALCYFDKNRIQKKLLRSTLAEVNQQLPDALKVHRSYLVNSNLIDKIEGNSRKRRVHLSNLNKKIPVSPNFPVHKIIAE